ncbi:MAG: hypothetical protein C0403_01795 [Desulfobacterium sp.]|nr:hypothetical protein [Desulfobacterium sp.]
MCKRLLINFSKLFFSKNRTNWIKGTDFNMKSRIILILCIAVMEFFSAHPAHAKKSHTVFFEGTDHELHVYKSFGKEPGKTLMLIGGIQGDEPGGFLSADLYADFSLSKGNLIVVPRANFLSIMLNKRIVNQDMNRKFAEDDTHNYETEIVTILKKLISESDILLNLHDGSGFYSDKWVSQEQNPERYGQSIIADCESFMAEGDGRGIGLGEMARIVSEKINRKIKNPLHHFHFNNHNTKEKSSIHKEQRKSATYYALYTCGIPAFGVETSKSLPLEEKVLHHNWAINAFMEELGIIPETPGINLDHPELRYLIISVNDSLPILVENQQTLFVKPGDMIKVSHIEANYERGLSADVIGFGTFNDTCKKIKIEKPTRIVARKDFYPCGSIYLSFSEDRDRFAHEVSVAKQQESKPPYLFFKVKINGRESILRDNDHVKLIQGDKILIEDIITGSYDPSALVVNFKGFVGDKDNNTGEDRGYLIDTKSDLLANYSTEKKGMVYQVVVTSDRETVGKLFFELEEAKFNYIVIETENHKKQCLVPGDVVQLRSDERVHLVDIITNVENRMDIKAYWSGPGLTKQYVKIKNKIPLDILTDTATIVPGNQYRLDVQRGDEVMGSVYFKLFSGDAS